MKNALTSHSKSANVTAKMAILRPLSPKSKFVTSLPHPLPSMSLANSDKLFLRIEVPRKMIAWWLASSLMINRKSRLSIVLTNVLSFSLILSPHYSYFFSPTSFITTTSLYSLSQIIGHFSCSRQYARERGTAKRIISNVRNVNI